MMTTTMKKEKHQQLQRKQQRQRQRQRQQKRTHNDKYNNGSNIKDGSSCDHSSHRFTKWWRAFLLILGCLLFATATIYIEADYLREFSTTSTTVPSSSITPAMLCQWEQENATFDSPNYTHIHQATFPVCMAGQWLYEPEQASVATPQHLQCLDQERQGNCHDPDSWEQTNDTARKGRHNNLLANGISNSLGILNASDPWVWYSNVSNYKVIPYHKEEHEQYRTRISAILSNRKIFLIGDSLTRQWSQVMRCEIMHILGKSEEEAKHIVSFQAMHIGFKPFQDNLFRKKFRNATQRDYVIFNFGHHVGQKLGEDWPPKYVQVLTEALTFDFGKIPHQHVFFRTTSVRHFLQNQGDWNTHSSQVGGSEPNMHALWRMYGGDFPEQPQQNLIAFDTLLSQFQMLDTSPMTLARGDASFDGSHLCLPGPMTYWSRMLYYQIELESAQSPTNVSSSTTPST